MTNRQTFGITVLKALIAEMQILPLFVIASKSASTSFIKISSNIVFKCSPKI